MNFEENRKYIQEWKLWVDNNNPTIKEQLDRWLKLVTKSENANCRFLYQCELSESGIQVLVRCRTHGIFGHCLVIATVKLPPEIQRKGWFKSFLTHCCYINPWQDVIIEDVENEHLLNFCGKMNFQKFNPKFITTYKVDKERVFSLKAKILKPYNEYVY